MGDGVSRDCDCSVCRSSRNAGSRTARIAFLRDAVVDAAVAYAAWCKRRRRVADGPVTPEAEEQAVCTAVDSYQAALKSESLDPGDGDPGIRWRKS